jgi:membrane protease YdiL (CAAX protease family)
MAMADLLAKTAFADINYRLILPPAAVLLVMGLLLGLSGEAEALAQWNVRTGYLSTITLLAFLALGACAARTNRNGWLALVLVALVYAVNIFILSLPRIGPFAELDWNWQGKTLDLVWMLAIIAMLSADQRREIGWTWQVRPGTLPVTFINIAILVVAGFLLADAAPGRTEGGLTLERLLFDASYPNLVEEIAFRGFMLALLDRAFARHWSFGGTQIGWGVVLTAWLFGLVHGLTLDAQGTLIFDATWLGFAFVMGLVLGWIRTLTGSLWPAFLAHAAPEIGILTAMALH